MTDSTYCGYIALCGRPNVGKSTLLNHLLGQKISITSKKPQTTRHQIIGIDTLNQHQMVFVDTPGIHQHQKQALNRYMNKAASSVISDVNVVAMVVDALHWTDDDELVLSKVKQSNAAVVLVINKIDTIKNKDRLLPFINELQARCDFVSVVPISAKSGSQVNELRKVFADLMPESPHFYDEDQITDKTTRFMVAEMIREKIFRLSGQELPYSITVEIEQFELVGNLYRVAGLVLVDKESHKRMIIGNHGEKLKRIGTDARVDMERLLEKKVFLQLWCKVKAGWADDERALQSLGYV